MNLSRQLDPLYLQIAAVLREELSGYSTGDLLPGELPLAKRFAVNRHTVRRALEVLVQEGSVLRIPGKGTQVLGSPLLYPVMETSAYSAWFDAMGQSVKAQLLKRVQRSAKQFECLHLGLTQEDQVVEYRTLRWIEDQPVSVIRHCFALKHDEIIAGYRKGSMRAYLRSQGQELTRVLSVIGARMPNTQEAAQLLMPENKPLLSVQTVSKNQEGQAFEVAFSVSRADRFQYHVVM